MADALASGASVRKDVGVQVPPRALGLELVQVLLYTLWMNFKIEWFLRLCRYLHT